MLYIRNYLEFIGGTKLNLLDVSMMKVKLCFKCKQYIPIRENDYKNTQDIIMFDRAHAGHPTQIVNEEEVANLEKWMGS